jgi:hypothetical protein
VTERDIREQLQQLADTVDGMNVDPANKAKLSALVDGIENQLQAPVAADDSSLPDQVDELVAVFESEHPTLAGILNRIMVTLSSMGV